MRTPDTPAYRQLRAERRHLATLRRMYGTLDNRWTMAMIRKCEDTIATLEWTVAEERREKRRATQKRADDKRRGKT